MDKARAVLLVDDDPDALESLQQVIERSGVTCHKAENGPEALTAIREHPVQVIISDHDMPGMDGVELLKIVATRYPLVSRILLTARRDAETSVRAINVAQAYRFISKPCRAGDLLTTLHFAFEAHEHEVENRRLAAQLRQAQSILNEARRRAPGVIEEIERVQPAPVA
ncbi:MAG TPA: response regulator [Myxococcales bacterium]|nr:response regulator [Myxococcales bacterium]